jgi:hypothetical protein
MLGIGSDGAQRLAHSPKKNVVGVLLVLKGDCRDGLRQGEDHVEILGVEKLRATLLQPLGTSKRLALGTMPIATAVVTDALMVTAIALLDMTTERGFRHSSIALMTRRCAVESEAPWRRR